MGGCKHKLIGKKRGIKNMIQSVYIHYFANDILSLYISLSISISLSLSLSLSLSSFAGSGSFALFLNHSLRIQTLLLFLHACIIYFI